MRGVGSSEHSSASILDDLSPFPTRVFDLDFLYVIHRSLSAALPLLNGHTW